jgi:5'(3')-deoxyribonucleotidase
MNIGIDIDGVIVNTPNEWVNWIEKVADTSLPLKLDYNLEKHVPNFKNDCGLDPFEFWNNHILYDNLYPIFPCIDVIRNIIASGHKVVFISHTKGEHLSSKFRFLKKHFPFLTFGYNGNASYIATKEKNLVNVDLMIDDRFYNLKHFNKDVIKIYLKTKFEDEDFEDNLESKLVSVDLITKEWADINHYMRETGIITTDEI